MTVAERFILIGCLLQGALCSTWSAWMPQAIQALNGSCLLIPCTFTIPSEENEHLINPVGVWWAKRGSSNKKIVFSSIEHSNEIEGNIIGNLSEKNCSTVLNKMQSMWAGHYFFRIQCNNPLKYNFKENVKINVEDSPPSPQITMNQDMVKEGDSVTLTCSAPAPCPSLPPTLSWIPRMSDNITVFQENDDPTKNISSVMTFTASHLLHKQEVKCTAVYRLQADNSTKKSHRNVTLNVQYSPKNTSVLFGKDRSLSCTSDANPTVINYTWYKMSGSEIKVVSYTQSLTSNITEVTDSGQYYCQAQNDHGLQNSSTVQLHCESAKAPPILIAAAAGAAGMILTCLLMQIPLKRRCTRENHSSKMRVNDDLTPTNETSQSENDGPQSTLYGNINRNVQNVLIGTGVMSDVQEEQEQYALKGMTGKRRKTWQPERGDVSGCGFRTQDSTETQKRKTEPGMEQETMENRKSSAPDDQLYTPEPNEEATYRNICHQPSTKGPDKSSAIMKASVEGQQDHHAVAFYPLISEETGTNECEYAVVRKVRNLQ